MKFRVGSLAKCNHRKKKNLSGTVVFRIRRCQDSCVMIRRCNARGCTRRNTSIVLAEENSLHSKAVDSRKFRKLARNHYQERKNECSCIPARVI